MSDLPRRNGWTLAEQAGDRTPDRTQRLLSRAVWDAAAAMSAVRRFAVGRAGRGRPRRRPPRLAVGALDETGQEKQGERTAGVKRQYLGCAGKVANGINTVHLAYVREKTGHALIGARQWIPREQIEDPVRAAGHAACRRTWRFRTKGQLAIDLLVEALRRRPRRSTSPAGTRSTAAAPSCGSSWRPAGRPTCCGSRRTSTSPLARGARLTCKQALKTLLKGKRGWEVRSAGTGVQGPALVRLGLDRHRLPAALPAGPPPPEDRRAGLSLLLRARGPAGCPRPG